MSHLQENYCRIFGEECSWNEDCNCYNQQYCFKREEKLNKEQLKNWQGEEP